MKFKRTPFAKAPKTEIVPIGNEDIGILYLLKRNARTAKERSELDVLEQNQSQGQLALFKLARRIAEERGVSSDEAIGLILGGQGGSPILLNYVDEMSEFLKFRLENDKLKDVVATTFIQNRIAYPVLTTAKAVAGSNKIQVAPLPFPLSEGDLIKFDSLKLRVIGSCEPGLEEILVAPLSGNIENERVGFLCDFESEAPLIGDSEWTSEDTAVLGESLIDAVFDFYQIESSGGVRPESEGKARMNQSDSSKNTAQENPLTGENSTGESRATEPVTIASAA